MSDQEIEQHARTDSSPLMLFLAARFPAAGDSHGPHTDLGTRTLHHATNSSAACNILSGGFRCGSSGCVGGGIYFADTPSAAQHKPRNGSVVLRADDVHLGNAFTIRDGVSRCDANSVDRSGSVCLPDGAAGGAADAEYVVFSASRVYNVSRA
jgi:hypothetical protein